MAQIDSYLKRIRSECNLSYLEDIYELYNFVPNVDLAKNVALPANYFAKRKSRPLSTSLRGRLSDV